MSFPFLPRLHPARCGDPGAEIAFACLFDGTQYMSRTPAAAGNAKMWSFSVEIKRAALGASAQHGILSASPVANYGTGIKFANDGIQVYHLVNGVTTWVVNTVALYRDPAAYLHVYVEYDSAAPAAADRVKIWVNGVLQTLSGTFPALNFETYVNTAVAHHVGADRLGTFPMSGYFAAFRFFDGLLPGAASCGYINRFGVWVPKRYTGEYGPNGWLLDFADPLDLGHDASGNGNHWTTSGITVANQVTDTPTNTYCTLNPLQRSAATLSNGALAITSALSRVGPGVSTIAVDASSAVGFYYEVKVLSGWVSNYYLGWILNGVEPYNSTASYNPGCIGIASNGLVNVGGVSAGSFDSFGVGDVIGIGLRAGGLYISKNGVPMNGGNPVATGILGMYRPWVSHIGSGSPVFSGALNFGQRAWAYPPPQGFVAIATPNLPCPPLKRPERYFTTRLRSGGEGVADLPWSPLTIKTLVLSKRLDGSDWRANDTLRPGRAWAANLTTGDFAEADGLTLTPTGYTIGAAAAYAGSRIDYIWRACPAAGFDIVLVDHVTGAPTTVPHAAGRLIDFAMVVPVGAGGQRRVYHRGLAAGQYLTLGGSSGTDSGWFASTAIDVTLGASMPTGKYALYVWGTVPQFSSFPTYLGNGGNPGPFSPADFAPAIAFYQGIGKHAFVRDTTQNPANPVVNQLNLCLAGGNAAGDGDMGFVSNGIARRNSSLNWNTSGLLHALAMWAGTPGKFSRAR